MSGTQAREVSCRWNNWRVEAGELLKDWGYDGLSDQDETFFVRVTVKPYRSSAGRFFGTRGMLNANVIIQTKGSLVDAECHVAARLAGPRGGSGVTLVLRAGVAQDGSGVMTPTEPEMANAVVRLLNEGGDALLEVTRAHEPLLKVALPLGDDFRPLYTSLVGRL